MKRSVVLPIELTNNNQHQSRHWSAAAKRREKYQQTMLAMGLLLPEAPDYPQKVTITRILGRKQSFYDADSLGRGNSKEIIDTLTAMRWWKDDGPKWITQVDFRQDASRRSEGPATMVEVEPA